MKQQNKPAYRIPSMAEIAELPLNGQRVVSLFSGCGGSSLGYRMAGFAVCWANEFIPAAAETYRANFPTTPIDTRDIREIKGSDILAATGLAIGELDILDGSPPCASFSTAGKRHEHWGQVKAYSDTTQRVDEYVRIVRELRPRRLIAENVSGLVKGVGKGVFLEILAALEDAGYRVAARLLDAQWLGVPQARQRIFFVGVRNDLDGAPAYPRPLPYRYSVRDALPWIGAVEHPNGWNQHAAMPASRPATTIQANRSVAVMTRDGRRSANRPAPTVVTHGRPHTRNELTLVEPEAIADGYAVGRELDKLGPGEQSAKYFSLMRAPRNGPSPTVTVHGEAHAASVAHPTERRKFSIAELRRICGFPDDFILTGTYAQQWERLGRAVPPPMMAALAKANIDGERLTEPLEQGEWAAGSPLAGTGFPPLYGDPSASAQTKRAGDMPAPLGDVA